MQTSYSFDVSTVEMRNEIMLSITEKIAAYTEEVQRLSAEICTEQEKLQSLMDDETVSLESIVAYKKEIFSALDAENRIKEIDTEITSLKSQLVANENASQETQAQRVALLKSNIGQDEMICILKLILMEILCIQVFLPNEMRSIQEVRQLYSIL